MERETGGERKKSRGGGLLQPVSLRSGGIAPLRGGVERGGCDERNNEAGRLLQTGNKESRMSLPEEDAWKNRLLILAIFWGVGCGFTLFYLFIYFLPVAAIVGRGAAKLQPWRWVRGRLCLLCSGLAGAGTHCGEGQQTGTAPTQILLWGSCGDCPGGHVMTTWSVLQAVWSDRGEMHRCADQWSRRGFRRGRTLVTLDDCNHVSYTASCLKGNSRFSFSLISSLSAKIWTELDGVWCDHVCCLWRWGTPVF